MTIRPFQPSDYQALAVLGDRAYSDAEGVPMLPMSAETIADLDASQIPPCRWGRWVVEEGGRLIGAAEFNQDPERYDPYKFWVDVHVDPEFQGRGWGSRLYEMIADELADLDARSGRCAVREDAQRALDFADRRGWREEGRAWESFLDLERLVLPAGKHTVDGIEIHSLAELADQPDRDQKVYELMWELDQDVPDLDEATRLGFDEFVEEWLSHRRMVPEYSFVATKDGSYIGLSFYRSDDSDPELVSTRMTGVARAWRGRGVAWALKLHGLRALAESPYRTVRTVNHPTNQAILAINEQLGFVRRPAWIDLVKVFR